MGFLAKKPAGAGPSALTTRHRGQQAEDAALAHLQAAVERRNPVSTLCYAGIRWMGVPYLKKNAGELQVRMRRQYLRAVQAGDLPDPGEAVLAEVRARTPGA